MVHGRLFSRHDLVTAVRFIASKADRVEIYLVHDEDKPRLVRVFVATIDLTPIDEPTLENVALVVRDFVPGKLAIEIVSVGEPIRMEATLPPTIPPIFG